MTLGLGTWTYKQVNEPVFVGGFIFHPYIVSDNYPPTPFNYDFWIPNKLS